MPIPPTKHAEGFGSMLCPQNVPSYKHRNGWSHKMPEELLLIKTLASVLISQLEKHRSQLVPGGKDEDLAVSPLKAKKKA